VFDVTGRLYLGDGVMTVRVNVTVE